MKKVWITALDKDPAAVQKLMTTMKTYGLDAGGHFWVDDLKRMAWNSAMEEMQGRDTALWIITGSWERFNEPSIRKGLSLLSLSLQSLKGHGFPVFILPTSGELTADSLPLPLRGADVIPAATATLGPKIVAAANMPVKPVDVPYHLYLHALEGIGLWFEVGPAKGMQWGGALFGVCGAEIDVHGIGPAKSIPERCVLEYPVKGMKVRVGEDEFTAWAVQNRLDDGSSYYVRIQGAPDRILFGPYAETDEAEMSILTLC
jgi:hypothetical protein